MRSMPRRRARVEGCGTGRARKTGRGMEGGQRASSGKDLHVPGFRQGAGVRQPRGRGGRSARTSPRHFSGLGQSGHHYLDAQDRRPHRERLHPRGEMRSVVFMKVSLLTLLLIAGVAEAQWKLPLFTADPREVLQEARRIPAPRDGGAFIINLETNIRLEESGKVHWIQRDVIRVLDDRGVRQFGMLVIPWVGWRQDRPKIKARVITRDGRAHDLEASTVVDGGFSHGAGSQMLSDTRAVTAA